MLTAALLYGGSILVLACGLGCLLGMAAERQARRERDGYDFTSDQYVRARREMVARMNQRRAK